MGAACRRAGGLPGLPSLPPLPPLPGLPRSRSVPAFSRVTFAPVWTRVGARPARESCAVSAIVKHPAWAAPISSSGLVAAWPSSNRDLNEYGPSKAPLPTLSRTLPSARLPFHSASAFRVGMEPPLALPPFSVSLFDALLYLLGRVPAITGA